MFFVGWDQRGEPALRGLTNWSGGAGLAPASLLVCAKEIYKYRSREIKMEDYTNCTNVLFLPSWELVTNNIIV
jgi:hypothetical protein